MEFALGIPYCDFDAYSMVFKCAYSRCTTRVTLYWLNDSIF